MMGCRTEKGHRIDGIEGLIWFLEVGWRETHPYSLHISTQTFLSVQVTQKYLVSASITLTTQNLYFLAERVL